MRPHLSKATVDTVACIDTLTPNPGPARVQILDLLMQAQREPGNPELRRGLGMVVDGIRVCLAAQPKQKP